MTEKSIETSARVTVWHDGACPLCRREIAAMRRLDHRGAIRFIDASESGNLCPVDQAARLRRFHAEEDGRMLTGAAAFAALWRAIPTLRPFGLAARNPIILASLEFAYRGFLVLRPTLQTIARRLDRRNL